MFYITCWKTYSRSYICRQENEKVVVPGSRKHNRGSGQTSHILVASMCRNDPPLQVKRRSRCCYCVCINTYQATTPEQFDDYRWRWAASPVDEAITTLLHARLEATFDSDTWAETITTYPPSYQKERKRVESQLAALERFTRGQIASLHVLSNPQMIRAVEKRYEEFQAEQNRLSAELSNTATEAERFEALKALRDTYLPAVKAWDALPRERRRVIVHAMVDHIEAALSGAHGLHLKIYWRDRSTDELVIARQSRSARDWLETELEKLLLLVDGSASQIEIMQAFPDRTWQSVRHRLWKIRGAGCVEAIDPKPIRDYETYAKFVTRIAYRRSEVAGDSDRRHSDEVKRLLALVDSGATQVEIASAFPIRRW